MHRITLIAAICLAVAGLTLYALGATASGGVTHAQAGASASPAPSGPGTSAAPGASAGPGGTGPAAPGASAVPGAAAGATAPPPITAERRKPQGLAQNEDVVADVISPSILKLDILGLVHLAGVTTPMEYFLLRSDYAHFEGAEPEPGNWKRVHGERVETNEVPDDYTYRTGEEDLRLFLFELVINRKVTVEQVGEYTLKGASKDWTMPDVILTFTRPQILLTDSTDPINVNDTVIAETKQIPMHNCQWELGSPARFDATTQSWANPKWSRETGRVAPSLRKKLPGAGGGSITASPSSSRAGTAGPATGVSQGGSPAGGVSQSGASNAPPAGGGGGGGGGASAPPSASA